MRIANGMRKGVVIVGSLAVCIVALRPGMVEAQDPRCTYQECALRIERQHLLQGSRGERVGRAGLFYNDLRILEQGPDSAAFYARKYRSDYRSGFLLFMAGLGLGTAGMVVGLGDILEADRSERYVPAIGLMTAALGASLWGSRKVVSAQVALARSVWWYNAGMIGEQRRPEPGGLPRFDPAQLGEGGPQVRGADLRLGVEVKVRLPTNLR